MAAPELQQASNGSSRNEGHVNHATPTANTINGFSYSIREQPLGTSRHIRIVCIGAGASGLNMIRTLRRHLRDYELMVYEKNADVGGTWFENRYPGCRCDVPSHNYQFSWRPNHEWSNFFSPAEEIRAYLRRVCDEEDMWPSIKTRHQIQSAVWDEEAGLWRLKVRKLETGDEFDDQAHFLLNAAGILNNWKWPDVAGLRTFKGDLIHTSNWPKNFDYANKTVAVIGNGSSGIQVLPAIQRSVKKLIHIMRSPSWIIPPRVQAMMIMGQATSVLRQIDMDENEDFSAAQIDKFKNDPEYYRSFVKAIEKEINNTFPILLKDGPIQAFARSKVVEYMTAMLGGNEKLCKALIPSFALGCRRMTPSPGYLRALTQPNVEVTTEKMKRFVPEGIEFESGDIAKVDAIICATGFDLSFRPRFPVVGRKGNLQDIWSKNIPKSYMSCAVAGMPNYFSSLKPIPQLL